MDDGELLRAKKKALSLLNYSDRTEWELMDKLTKADFSEEVVNEALEYVKSFHYIDDERYAMNFVDVYHKSRSIKRIWQDLRNKHVPDKYISLAIESIEGGDSAALERELRKILKKGQSLEEMTYEERQKVAAKLYRKGFSASDVKRCIEMSK